MFTSIVGGILLRSMNQVKQPIPISKYLELAARIYVWGLLSIYGLGKISGGQFYRKGALPEEVAATTLREVGSFDLAWTFMGHSYTYILFIGISQLIGAWMLLFDRTKLLGVAILIPILINIIVFDAIFFDDGNYGALFSACVYMSLLMLILYLNKGKVIKVFNALIEKSPAPALLIPSRMKLIAISLVIIGAFFGLEQMMLNVLGR